MLAESASDAVIVEGARRTYEISESETIKEEQHSVRDLNHRIYSEYPSPEWLC